MRKHYCESVPNMCFCKIKGFAYAWIIWREGSMNIVTP